jgi:hypothetical protein
LDVPESITLEVHKLNSDVLPSMNFWAWSVHSCYPYDTSKFRMEEIKKCQLHGAGAGSQTLHHRSNSIGELENHNYLGAVAPLALLSMPLQPAINIENWHIFFYKATLCVYGLIS